MRKGKDISPNLRKRIVELHTESVGDRKIYALTMLANSLSWNLNPLPPIILLTRIFSWKFEF